MSRRPDEQLWSLRGLRTRFKPRSRLGQGLISVGPWVDLVLLVVMCAMLHGRVVLQPGLVVNLPEAPFTQGTHLGLTAVVLSMRNPDSGARDAIVFFDDERFLVGDAGQMQRLGASMARRAKEHPAVPLVIQADESIAHGTVMSVVNVAAGVGIRKINVATRSN